MTEIVPVRHLGNQPIVSGSFRLPRLSSFLQHDCTKWIAYDGIPFASILIANVIREKDTRGACPGILVSIGRKHGSA